MITVEQTTDIAYLDQVMHDPRISAAMTDDNYPDPTKFSIAPAMEKYPSLFLKVLVDGTPAGWFWFRDDPSSPFTLEVHTALLPNCRGRAALQAGQNAMDWVFGHTPCQLLTTFAWTDDPAPAWFADHMGFDRVGQEPYPCTRRGKPVDIIHFSFPRNRWVTQRN